MRRFGVITLALLLLALLGMPAPPAQAQAPAPKVTLGGTFDVVTSAHWNLSQVDADFTRSRDSIWISRQRTTLVALGEVEKARGVLAFELDFGWGMTGPGTSATVPGAAPQMAFSTGNAFGASNDNLNALEIKQMYIQFPLPLVPWPTTLRLGGQPGAGTVQYKPVVYFDDFPGVYLVTTMTPAVKFHLLYAQHDEDAFGCTRPRRGQETRDAGVCGSMANTLGALGVAGTPSAAAGGGTNFDPRNATRTSFQRGDDYVLGLSLDVTPIKGFDVRPHYIYWTQKGVFNNTQNTPLPTSGVGGVNSGRAFGSDQAKRERHYAGLDARWRSGPFSFDPTFIYLWGINRMSCGGLAAKAGHCDNQTPTDRSGKSVDQDIRAWMVDLRGGWRTGPLLLEGFFLYTPGNDARDNMGNTAGAIADQNFFQPVNTGGGYSAGWSNFFTSNEIDFLRAYAIGTSVARGSVISYDRYGALVAAFKPSYALTRALTLKALAAASWTAEDVDSHGVFSAASGWSPETQGNQRGGDENFLGWELATGLTWAFAPGLTFDAGVAHLFAGEALDQCRFNLSGGQCAGPGGSGGGSRAVGSAKDASSVAARVRFAF